MWLTTLISARAVLNAIRTAGRHDPKHREFRSEEKAMITAIRSLFGLSRKSPAKSRKPSRSSRFTLESLGDRCLLSGGAPNAPVFTPAPYSSSQVNLSWQPVPTATSYQVEIVSGGRWEQLGSLSGSATGCAVTGLSANTTYDFDVVASNAYGSTWGNQQFATTGIAVNHPAAATAYSPVSGTLFGSNGPSYLDVKQGDMGDCWLLASLAEVAARDPQDIRNMFTSDGTTVENGVVVSLYNVRFFDNGTPEYVTVDTELPSGGQYYDQPVNGVLWVALAEKAYAQANGSGWVTSGDDGSDSYNALDTGSPCWALSAITGKAANGFNLSSSTNLAADWNAGDLIVLGSDSNPSNSDIVSGHAYAVVGFNASSSDPFLVYNPWGTNSSGWVMNNATGQWVYGLFNAGAGFLSQNFATYSVGSGSANPIANLCIASDEVAVPSLVAVTDISVPTRFVQAGNEVLRLKPQTSDWSAGQASGTPAVDPSLIEAILMDVGNAESAYPSGAGLVPHRARMI
jgi:Calpain family cysteine protease/Fibronectin type III domain